MIIVKLKGGLGNQMFQFAAAFAKSKEFNSDLIIDLSFLESNVQETSTFTPRKYGLDIFQKIGQFQIRNINYRSYREINNKNFESKFQIQRIFGYYFILNDYFQSENYFLRYKQEIVEIFSFDTSKISNSVASYLKQIKSQKLISIHLRRGDYLKPEVKNIHGLCSIEYYLEAIEIFKQKVNNPQFILFSDEPEKAELELKPYLSDFITYKSEDKNNAWVEMYLMSQCSGNIIANSTFSWWGAYLNTNENTVIAPKNWFLDPKSNNDYCDLIPNCWISI